MAENSELRTGTLPRAPTNSAFRHAPRWVHGCPEPHVVQGEIRNRLIIFTRYPQPGKSKTRLIPTLGPEGAADLQRRMTEHTLAWARRLKSQSPVSIEVRYEGGNESLFQQWLGSGLFFQDQGEGDLGARMARAFEQAFQSGMERVVLVGTDIPALNEGSLLEAFEALNTSDLLLGPAKDGGYYLIGLRRPVDALFKDISWGTEGVLSQTLKIAQDLGLRVLLLDTLDDVDRPEDLPVWEKFSSTLSLPCGVANLTPQGKPSPAGGRGDPPGRPYTGEVISIIIPTLNEEENIAACLATCQNCVNVERIVVDGGSQDRTAEIARSWGARVIQSLPGRARQMNLGAELARGELLLFLHADTRLPQGFEHSIRETLSSPGTIAGAFEFCLDLSSPALRFIERMTNWRSRLLQLPYGDQAIFIRSSRFREIGGFPDLPIMEDFVLIRRLKKRGRIRTVPLPAVTSARRWQALGVWKTTLMNQLIVLAYYLGVAPSRIQRLTRRKR